MPLDPIQIREAFHCLVLQCIAPGEGLALRVKGCVNLRFFYGSERYSEDMDLDADARLRQRLKVLLRKTLHTTALRRNLLALGVRDLDLPERPAKDTETVLRYKLRLIAAGVPYPTKIEVSYRGEAPAVWQKITALALRNEVQARDVFDLNVLLSEELGARPGPVDAAQLRDHLSDQVLREAGSRALDISPEQFEDQVAEFLRPDARARHRAQWDATQVRVASFIEHLEQQPRAAKIRPRGAHPMSQVGPIVLRDITPRAPIFTTTTAAAAAGVSRDTASRALARLADQRLVTRLVRGLWADTRHPDFSPYALVPFILARSTSTDERVPVGYVSFLSALQLHAILSQIPPAIQVAVAEQREPVHTPVGTFEFHQIQPDLLDGYKPGDAYGRFEMATPAKALFDTLYLSARRGRRFSHLPELAIRGAISDAEVQRWIARIEYPSLRTAVTERWIALRRLANSRPRRTRRP